MRYADASGGVLGRRAMRLVGGAGLFLLVACGSASQSLRPGVPETLASPVEGSVLAQINALRIQPNATTSAARADTERLQEDRPRRYAGYVKILFHNEPGNETDIRWARGAFVSRKPGVDVRALNTTLRACPIAKVAPGVAGVTDTQMTVAYRYMVAHNIPGAYDWNGFYKLSVADAAAAQACAQALGQLPIVRAAWAHYAVPDAGGLDAPTPDFTPEQKYLQANEMSGGLNVVAAWDPPYNLTGDGIHIWTTDNAALVGHEDLPLQEGDVVPLTNEEVDIQHGTGTAGILVGKKNAYGVTGMSYHAKIHIQDTGGGSLPVGLANWNANPQEPAPFVREGDILIAMDAGPCGMPPEAGLDAFLGLQQLTGLGVTVVEAGGNDGKALGECALSDAPAPYLTEDSGAILVGASEGASHYYNPISNCGPRVDVYAWGKEVVTTGYGDFFPGLDQTTEENKTRWYNYAYFWGTSAATAQIGGVVTLLQEYVRKHLCPYPAHALGDPGQVRCYLPPKTMRQLLKDAGIGNEALMPDPDNPGQMIPKTDCPIGVQPDVGKALQLLDTGAYQPAVKLLPAHYKVVNGIRYDLDGDGRAELISFSRDGKWYIDLSATPPDPAQVSAANQPANANDGYGAWDLVLVPSPPSGGEGGGEGALPQGMWFPVVHDYNSDGRADLALYDSKNGQWYIRFTDADLLAGTWGAWTRLLDYSKDPHWQPYSRPVPGDFNGDHWLDTAVTTPDGHWVIDYGGFTATLDAETQTITYTDQCGKFDEVVKFLTDEQLAAAPGWAYVPGVAASVESNGDTLVFKVPDGVPQQGEGGGCSPLTDGTQCGATDDLLLFGGMDVQFIPLRLDWGLSAKFPDGQWKVEDSSDPSTWASVPPEGGYGGINCRPVPADYDGDSYDDRAVQCGTIWKVAYTGYATYSGQGAVFPVNADGFRIVEEPLGILDPVPGYVYGGGISYEDLKAIYGYYDYGKKNGTIFDLTPPPIGPHVNQCIKYWAVQPPACLGY